MLLKIESMNPNMTFEERAKLGMENLAKQLPTTFEEKKEQFWRLKNQLPPIKRKKHELQNIISGDGEAVTREVI